jgi:hypothetical protein
VGAWEVLAVLCAGAGAGALNAVIGAGSLISFPTLVALGVPPVTANVSNTLGLVPGSVAAALGYRAELSGRGPLVRRLLVPAVLGGLTGATLLLVLPASAFEAIVPVLLLVAAALVWLQPRVATWLATRRGAAPAHGGVELWVGVGLTAVYGGYFGAAQGVLLLALLGILVEGSLQSANGVKNVLAGTANLTAAVVFVLVADVDWAMAGLIALGAWVGGTLGARYGRRLPDRVIRLGVVVVAVVVAVRWAL